MKLSKVQREQHRGAAQALIAQLERRLGAPNPSQRHRQRLAECVDAYKALLESNPRDHELLRINLELADLFYQTCSASKQGRSSAA